MSWMLWLWLLGGVVIGSLLTLLIQQWCYAYGVIVVDRSDPEKDRITLTPDDEESLFTKKKIVFKIIQKNSASK